MTVRDRFVTIDGIRTHVTEAGSGRGLLLIHGLGGPLMWQRVIDPLSKSFRVIAIDLPGFGRSDCPPEPFSTDAYARFIANAIEEMEMRRPIVAGISYGGQVAGALACKFPNSISGLVLIGSTGLTSNRQMFARQPLWAILQFISTNLILPSETLTCALGKRSFFNPMSRPEDLCRNFHRQVIEWKKRLAWSNALRNVLLPDIDFVGILPHLDVTTLIIWGTEDRLVPAKCAAEISRLIPDSKLVLVPNCGHSLPLEKAEDLCSAIVSFYPTGNTHRERILKNERRRVEDQRSTARVYAHSRH